MRRSHEETEIRGDIPTYPDSHLKPIITGTGGTIEFGAGVTLTGKTKIMFLEGGGTLIIGSKVKLRGIFIVGDASVIAIGHGTKFNRHSMLVAMEGASIRIGERCLFSNTTLRTCDMHSVLDAEGTRINPSRSIVLQDRVWLGENSYISKGVTVGHDSIVAANAVVVKPVKPHTIVAGSPAEPIRSGISWIKRRIPTPALDAYPTLEEEVHVGTSRLRRWVKQALRISK